MQRRQSDTQKITMGAMIIALFAILLIINRQTAGFFEGFFIYLLPIPMVAYASQFDIKSSFAVFFGMAFISFFFGTVTSIFYALTAALLGLIFGTRLRLKKDLTVTMFIVMGLSALFTIISTIALASVFGYDLNADVAEVQNMMSRAFSITGGGSAEAEAYTAQILSVFSADFLKRMMIISMGVMGLLDGFIIYHLSLLVLRRLRVPVPAARPVSSFYPPRWTGWVAFLGYVFSSGSITGNKFIFPTLASAQTVWICTYLFLYFFGILAIAGIIRKFLTRKAVPVVLLTILFILLFAFAVPYLAFAYISFGFHEYLEKSST